MERGNFPSCATELKSHYRISSVLFEISSRLSYLQKIGGKVSYRAKGFMKEYNFNYI